MSATFGGGGYTSRSGLNPRQQGGQADGGHVQIRVDPANKFDFDSEVDGLRSHVKKIKQMSLAIEEERKLQGEIIDDLEDTMERARHVLRSAMGRMNIAFKQVRSNHMLFLILFAVFLFFGLYVLAKFYRLGRMVVGK